MLTGVSSKNEIKMKNTPDGTKKLKWTHLNNRYGKVHLSYLGLLFQKQTLMSLFSHLMVLVGYLHFQSIIKSQKDFCEFKSCSSQEYCLK